MDHNHKYDVVDNETGEILMEGFEFDTEVAIWAVARRYKILRVETPDDPDFKRHLNLYQQGVGSAPPPLYVFIAR
jgi:hypothetical protein